MIQITLIQITKKQNMEAIKINKKELQEISKLNPNNDVFNQMIAELSK